MDATLPESLEGYCCVVDAIVQPAYLPCSRIDLLENAICALNLMH